MSWGHHSNYSEWERQRSGKTETEWREIERISKENNVDYMIAQAMFNHADKQQASWVGSKGESLTTSYTNMPPDDSGNWVWRDGGLGDHFAINNVIWNTWEKKEAQVQQPIYPVYVPPPPNIPRPAKPDLAEPQPPVDPGEPPSFTYETQAELVKYEYVQGIREIQIRGSEYEQRSIYVSKPVDVYGNVMEVSLSAKEVHPLFDELTNDAGVRQTSIEYYISYEENPSLEDWVSVLPEEVKEVYAERLFFETARTATLRFPALTYGNGYSFAKIYKDGVLLARDEWAFLDNGTRIQLMDAHQTQSIYVIDYLPSIDIRNPWQVTIDTSEGKRVKVTDRFPEGTNHNKTVRLSQYPYVDYAKVNQLGPFNPNNGAYKPIQVSLVNANIAGVNRTTIKEVLPYDASTTQDAYTLNVTDYKTGAWKAPQQYSLRAEDRYKGFEYWQDGNKLYFSETFNKADINENLEVNHGNAEIVVHYETIQSSFRTKIILRRNAAENVSLSPSVESYTLKFKSMK